MAKSAPKESKGFTFKVEGAREWDDEGEPTVWSEILNSRNTKHPTEKQAQTALEAERERLTHGRPDRLRHFRGKVIPA